MADISRSVKNPAKGAKIIPITAARTAKVNESGSVFYINTTTALTVTLPKITKANSGMEFQVSVGALAASSDHRITPATGDTIFFAPAGTASATVSQSLVFTAATDHVGQYATLVADYALLGWVVVGCATAASLAKA